MFLSRLSTTSFRKLKKADATFHPSLNVIVGENNSGKTAVIDAIRSGLGERQFEQDDLTYDVATKTYATHSSIELRFTGLSLDDEAAFLPALVPGDSPSKYDARIKVTATQRGDDIVRELAVGSNTRGGAIFEVLQHRRVIYLPALRDPESASGLRPGRQSQLAQLLKRVTNDQQRQELVDAVADANNVLKAFGSVETARKLLADNLVALSGPTYAQSAALSFVEPEFLRIAGNLEALAADMQIGMNGLGASNLYYIAAVLADLVKDKSVQYRALLIEEPEAHLHPHYQILLLRFLKETAEDVEHPVQVFVTTHSPILASQAASDGILPIVVFEDGYRASPIPIDQRLTTASRVRQYLDATRSELFFARHILMVEGDAELFLVAPLAKILGVDLAARGVSVISAAGLNFGTFLPFVKGDILGVPVAILTDKDPVIVRNEDATTDTRPSDYFASLERQVEGDSKVRIFGAEHTFERDLAIPIANRRKMIDAMKSVRPRKASAFEKGLTNLDGDDFPALFYSEFFGPNGATSKAEFAMALSLLLADDAGTFMVPNYIAEAVRYLAPPVSQ